MKSFDKLFKLANYLGQVYGLKSMGADYYEPGRMTPAFSNGDLVRNKHNGKKAIYLTPVTWSDSPGRSVIHYLSDMLTLKDWKGERKWNFSYVNDSDLELAK